MGLKIEREGKIISLISINMYAGSTRIFERHSQGGVGTAEYRGGTCTGHVQRGAVVTGGSPTEKKGPRTVRQRCDKNAWKLREGEWQKKDIYKKEYTESDRGQRYESRVEQKAKDDAIREKFFQQQKEEWERKQQEEEKEKDDDEDEDNPEDESNWSEEKKKRMEEVRRDKLITERRERAKLAERLKKQEERDVEDRRLVRNWQQRKKDARKDQDKDDEQKKEDEWRRLAQEAENKGYTEEPEPGGDGDEIPSGSKPKPKRKTPKLSEILAKFSEEAGASTSKDSGRKLWDRGVKRPKEEAEDDEFEEIDDEEQDEDYEEEEGEEEAELEPGAADFDEEDNEGIPDMEDDIGGPEHVHCANATSAKLYRKYLVRELRELKRSVGRGIGVPEAYEKFIASLIQGLLDMNIYMKVENARINKILELIPDQNCKVWKRMILGRKTLTEGQMAEMYDDLTRPVVKQEEEAKRPTPWEIILKGVEKETTKGNIRRKAKMLFTEVELTHTHTAKVAGYLKEMAEEVPTDEGYLALVECAARPMVAIFTPKLDDLQHERKVQRKEISQKMKDLLEEGEVDKIASEVCVPIVNPAWKDSKDVEDQATASLAAMVAWLVRYGMGEKHIPNVTATTSAFHVSRSTLSKMITGKKFYGGKQAKKMKAAGKTTSSKGKAGKFSQVKKSKKTEEPEEDDDEEKEQPMVH